MLFIELPVKSLIVELDVLRLLVVTAIQQLLKGQLLPFVGEDSFCRSDSVIVTLTSLSHSNGKLKGLQLYRQLISFGINSHKQYFSRTVIQRIISID